MGLRKILIANRGEIARRIQRTCREMGIATVAVYSEPDADAPFVHEADEAVALAGATPAESYLDVAAVVAAARRTGADAVHPGYGFLAENAAFARAVTAAGLVFIGPGAETIAVMGSKVEAKRLMGAAGVPLLPGAEIEPGVDPAIAAGELGYPLLVKASAGGGGKGMRIVSEAAELEAAIASAGREAAAAFGDGTLFLERYLSGPRHVEVQILGDAAGRVVHLYERECSIQRRHQKILEESPSPAVDDELRRRITAAAVRAGEAVGYRGAGTVEFLLDGDGEFYFLEMNTRLQVEHPVTEAITGVDLVRLQIELAEGTELPSQERMPAFSGHAIEVRLYAEDPRHDFRPTTGTVVAFDVDGGVRLDSGVEAASHVTPHYDPMLAKVIAWAPTRIEAAHRLAGALTGARIHGLRTNRELLVRLLRHPEFLAGGTDTDFLVRHHPADLGRSLVDPEEERLHALAAALAAQHRRRSTAVVLGSLPSGWRNLPVQPQRQVYDTEEGEVMVEYRFGREGLSARVDGSELERVRLHRVEGEVVDLEAEGVRRRYRVHQAGRHVYVDSVLGASELVERDRLPAVKEEVEPGSLVAPMPGTVVQVAVAASDVVAEGEVLLVMEAMKMELAVRSPVAGRVAELYAHPGEQVEAGRVLAVIEEDT